jgi:acyl carrier protein
MDNSHFGVQRKEEIMSKQDPRSKAMRIDEAVADYVDQRDEQMLQALVTAGAFIAVADGQIQVVERDELIDFVTRQGFVPASSKQDVAEAFDSRVRQLDDSRVRQLDGRDMFIAVFESVRPLAGMSLSSVVVRTAERVAHADRELHPSEIEALNVLRGMLANEIESRILIERTTPTKEVPASSDVRVLVANHLGVSVDRVADTAHFSHDLGADWLDRLDLVMAIEDQFPGLQISDDELDRMELVGDLMRLIEAVDDERRRRGTARVERNLFSPRLAHSVKPTKQQKGCEEGALLFLRVAGDGMRSLIGWCHETQLAIDLQLHVDEATLVRIGSNAVRFQCPHCGMKHETKVERLASKPFSLKSPQTKHMRGQYDARGVERERFRCDA